MSLIYLCLPNAYVKLFHLNPSLISKFEVEVHLSVKMRYCIEDHVRRTPATGDLLLPRVAVPQTLLGKVASRAYKS